MASMSYDAKLCYAVIPTKPGTLNWTSYTYNVDSARIYLPGPGVYSTPVTPTSNLKTAQHEITGLDVGTTYDYQLQVEVAGVWSTVVTSTHHTLPATTEAARTIKIGAFACDKVDADQPSGSSNAWLHAATRGLDLGVHLGDWHYRENESTDQDQHWLNLIRQSYEYVTGMGALFASLPFYYFPSDHEFGDNTNTGGTDFILAFEAMWRKVWAQYESPLDTETALCWSTNVGNDIELVFFDFRNYERTNSDDPNIPFDDPRRAACGPEQMAWMLGKIRERHRFTVLFSDPVWLSLINQDGTEGELTNKTDAWASYTYSRSLVAAAMEDNPNGLLVTGDYHLMIYCSAENNPHGHWPVVGAAGVDAQMTYRGGDYDEVYPSLDQLPNNPAMNQWLEVDLVDNVSSMTVNTIGWDALDVNNPVARVTSSQTYDLSQFVQQPLTITPTLDRMVLSEVVSDPNVTPRFVVAGSAGAVGGGSGKVDSIEQIGGFRQYGNGNTRLILGSGQTRTQTFALRALTPDQVQTVKDLMGRTVCLRDTYGRRIFGAYLAPSISNIPGSGGLADVGLVFQTTTYDEAV